jgi:para-aminobenzoate synthetase / 4-amino-4-deoxychorismate lyase
MQIPFNQKEPLLSFEFATNTGKIQPLTFKNPQRVIVAETIADVLPSFQLIQDEIKNGNYAAGFLSYESAPAFDSAFKVRSGHSMPLLWFGIFQQPEKQTIKSDGTFKLTEWKPSVSPDEYHESILSIKDSIENGDTYQTNYTIRLNSQFQGDDIAFFEKLKRAQASNYCAYIHTGKHSILSASPELFFQLKEGKITTRPMKGTIKRGKTFADDTDKADWLYHSEKNRAENVMIVDLLRNDLGVIAEAGTVQVEKLFEIEQYPTVHQMTSTITAKVTDKTELFEVFKALFPCGSITGAPKISTMNVISNLESTPREVYCGAIGFISPDMEAVFNVPIRTVVIEQETGKATYGVGGGITWDSTTEDEYDEILAKASLLQVERPEFQLLESLLLEQGEYFLLAEHLNRLNNSASYFGFEHNIEEIEKALVDFAAEHGSEKLKVRLLVARNGAISVEGNPLGNPLAPLKVSLATQPVNEENPFLYHKTTNRVVYTEAQNKMSHELFDVLLWNNKGELTEFTNGNVVLEIEGKCWTPPVESGLLLGTFREMLLKSGEISEKTLTVGDLKECTKVWFINSVRKWLEVEF